MQSQFEDMPKARNGQVDAVREDDFEEILLFEKPALFTNGRIDRDTVPKGVYAYDIRETEGFSGIPCSVERFVVVNHMGTVLTRDPIKKMKDGFRSMSDDDIGFGEGECRTLQAFMEKHQPTKIKGKYIER